jgi:hypothetical protein
MQRLGRINRIGSKADFINVYNFYPSAQGDAEINIVKRAWNKIQAFHELFGEDSKIFSKEEELIIHELIQHEEDDEAVSLKYADELKRFRIKHPKRYAELENLMEKVVSARMSGKQAKIAAHVRNAGDQWYYAYTDHAFPISQTEMIEMLECPETEKPAELDKPVLDAALSAILEHYTTERQNEKINIKTRTSLAAQKRKNAMNILNDYAHIADLSTDSSKLLSDVLHSVRKGNTALINEIEKTRPNAQAVFAEADISNWAKYVHVKNSTDEKGIITLAMQGFEGGN